MEIKQVDITKLVPYSKNAKKHDDVQISNVAESIKQFGMVQPIVIDKDNVVVIGHCRLEACKKLGYKEVPCVIVDDLTEEQVAKLRLLDNKLNESDWDYDLLSQELEDLDLFDFTLDWGIISPDNFGEDFELPDGEKSEIEQMTFTLHREQAELIRYAISIVEECVENFGNSNKNGNALYEVVRQWAEQKK